MSIPYVTKEQTSRAREIPVLEYVLRYEGDKYKRVGSGYRSKEHESLAVSDKGFYWHSTGDGGKTALDYLMSVRNYDFVSAVCHLIGEAPYEKGDNTNQNSQRNKDSPPKSAGIKSVNTPSAVMSSLPSTATSKSTPPENKSQSEQQQIILPRRNKDNYHVIAYLQNRGIDRDVIMDCINRGVLYESALHHNAVFLGKDENGKTRFAAMRGIQGDFKCDTEGSNKKYGFVVPPKNISADNPDSQAVMIFESPIDCLSHQTLCKRGIIPDFDGWRLSLGGTSGSALIGFIERHSNINHCIIATDNDEAGNAFAERMADKITIPIERVHLLHGKDWNDALLLALRDIGAVRGSEHANEQASRHTPHNKQDAPEL